jgi:Fic family protein
MKPFQPHLFPPKRLHQKSYSKLLKRANRALDRYNAEVLQSPNFKLFSSQLINLESIASVESQKATKKSKLALVEDYRKALVWACKEIKKRPLSKEMICKIHKMAKNSSPHKKELGHFRSRQNWIGPNGGKIEEAYFYPPEANQVDKLMEELLHSLKKKEKEPLVQLALFFDQLLIIHPFMDGNGRVARILIPLFLYQRKAIPAPFFFMSRYLLKHRLQYFQNLYTTQDTNRWEPWIAFFLRGVISEARYSLRLFKEFEPLKK